MASPVSRRQRFWQPRRQASGRKMRSAKQKANRRYAVKMRPLLLLLLF